jgi:hypothetical protein
LRFCVFCEKMGTGYGQAAQDRGIFNDWPVPVPIFSQAKKWGLAPAKPGKIVAFSRIGRCLSPFFHTL